MQSVRTLLDRTIPLDFSLGEPCLACPVCGGNYVHPTGLICLPPGGTGRGLLMVNADGIHLNPTVKPLVRGVSIILEFVCEQGHAFAYRLEFHKGQTYVAKLNRKAEDFETPSTIWRD